MVGRHYQRALDVARTTLLNDTNPGGVVRQLVFGRAGEGLVTYLVLEDQRRVDVLEVQWAG